MALAGAEEVLRCGKTCYGSDHDDGLWASKVMREVGVGKWILDDWKSTYISRRMTSLPRPLPGSGDGSLEIAQDEEKDYKTYGNVGRGKELYLGRI